MYIFNIIVFSDEFENPNEVLALKKSLMNLRRFHFVSQYSCSSYLLKITSLLGPRLKTLCFKILQIVPLELIFELIESRKSTLKEINFYHCGITDSFLESVSNIKDLYLRSVILRGCDNITDRGVKKLIESQKYIRRLDISSRKLTDKSVSVICEKLPKIETLRMNSKGFADVSLHCQFVIIFFLLFY